MSVAETDMRRTVLPEEIERLAEKLSWPPTEASEEVLALMREIISGALTQIRDALGELRELVDALPAPPTAVVPTNLEGLRPGSDLELFGVLPGSEPDSAHTNAVWYLLEEVAYILPQAEALLDELERYAEDAERATREEIRALLAAIPESLFRAIERQADRTGVPP